MKILMVCLGNICRSPIAEGIMKQKCEEAGLDWEIDSAGTLDYHEGSAPHIMSQAISKLNGVDISKQKSRPIVKADFTNFDLIIPMAIDVITQMQYILKDAYNADKVELLLNYPFPGTDIDVPDPWGKTEAAFHEVYDLIDHACDAMIKELTSTKQ